MQDTANAGLNIVDFTRWGIKSCAAWDMTICLRLFMSCSWCRNITSAGAVTPIWNQASNSFKHVTHPSSGRQIINARSTLDLVPVDVRLAGPRPCWVLSKMSKQTSFWFENKEYVWLQPWPACGSQNFATAEKQRFAQQNVLETLSESRRSRPVQSCLFHGTTIAPHQKEQLNKSAIPLYPDWLSTLFQRQATLTGVPKSSKIKGNQKRQRLPKEKHELSTSSTIISAKTLPNPYKNIWKPSQNLVDILDI